MAKHGVGLLQEDVDAAVVDRRLADVGLISTERRVEGDQRDIAALGEKSGCEAIIAEAASANHACGARG